ncbi:MAG: hypothetical protein ABWY02_15760 [Telluria sp.]
MSPWQPLPHPSHGEAAPGPATGVARAARGAGLRTRFWAALYLLQELSMPMSGTATHSIRTLAPFLLWSRPACLLLSAAAAIGVLAVHGLSAHTNLLISLTVLLMPIALLGTAGIGLDIALFARTVIRVLFAACVLQALFPGLSNQLFAPFIDGFLRFDAPFSRATGLSMEPSFAAEMLFAAAAIHFFFTPRLWSPTTLLILGALLLIRAGTSIQQALLFALVYLFLRCARALAGTPAWRNRVHPALGLAATLFALGAMLSGYSLLVHGTVDLSFIPDSAERFNSWRTLSNYAAWVDAPAIAFFPHDANSGWGNAIGAALRSRSLPGEGWVTQPFSAIGVAFLDLGAVGGVLWAVLVFAVAARRLRPYALDTVQAAIVYTLLANGLFFAPKWQLSGFLAVGLIAAAIDASQGRRRHPPAAP